MSKMTDKEREEEIPAFVRLIEGAPRRATYALAVQMLNTLVEKEND